MTRDSTVVGFLLVVVALALVHKFPILVAALLLLGLASTSLFGIVQRRSLTFLLAFTGLVLLTVWTFTTTFLINAGLMATSLIRGGFEVNTTLADPAAATRVAATLRYTVARNAHWIALCCTGGIGWAFMSYHVWTGEYDRRTSLEAIALLLCASLLMLLLAMSLFGVSGTLNPVRVLLLAAVPLAVLVGALVDVTESKTRRRSAAPLVIVALLAIQISAVGVFPDDGSGPRDYLTTEEYEGKAFAVNHTTETVHTDSYYVRAGVNPRDPVSGYWSRDRGRFQSYDSAVFNGSFEPADPTYVAYRTSVDTYGHLPWGGYWSLDWDPQDELRTCGNRVYSNGDVDLYETDRCWTDDA